jgi:hypothetical protein
LVIFVLFVGNLSSASFLGGSAIDQMICEARCFRSAFGMPSESLALRRRGGFAVYEAGTVPLKPGFAAS